MLIFIEELLILFYKLIFIAYLRYFALLNWCRGMCLNMFCTTLNKNIHHILFYQ